MKKTYLVHSLVLTCLGGLALLSGSCIEDHPPRPTTCEQLLTGCTAGWRPVGVYTQGILVGAAAPPCYRLIFRNDGTAIYNRSRCTDEDTSAVVAGSWSCSSASIQLPERPQNSYGPPGGGRIEQLTTTSLQFSFRSGLDQITELWTCE